MSNKTTNLSSNSIKSKKNRIVVTDDHPRMRAGIISLINQSQYGSDFEVVGEAKSGYQALVLCKEKKPDILILDLQLGDDMSGFEVINEIRQQKIPLKILVLTATVYARNAAARDMGADAYLLKSESDNLLIETLYEMAQRESISPQDYKTSRPPEEPKKSKILTTHEIQLLQLAASGLIQSQIAQQLQVEKGSVGVAFTRIYEKIGVRNLPEAITFAFRNKLLE